MADRDRPTIKDVARIANVSTATVSHVVNQTRFVSEEVRRRVLDAMRETNYTSNYIARALRSSKTKTIGVVIPDLTNPFFSILVYHMEVILHEAGYMMMLCDSRESVAQEKETIERLCASQVDGIVLAPISAEFDYVEWSRKLDCPFVFIDRHPNGQNYNGVFCTVRNAVAEAVEKMILAGHDCVAILNRDTGYSIIREREYGYMDALKRNGIKPDEQYIFRMPATSEHGYSKTADILRDMPEVTGLFCANRHIALGALHCLIDRGVAIPDQMSIAGFAAYNWYNVTTPRLSTVLEPIKDMGENAARLMLGVLENPDRPPEKIVLDAHLIGTASLGHRRAN